MLATHVNTLRWIYRKNTPDLVALLRRNYPRFVFERQPAPLRDELPVFTFHTVEPRRFETTLAFLAHNGYRTLSAEEFQLAVAGEGELAPASVLLTFDDGLASLWTVAEPLLRKYGFRGVSFLVPGCIPETAPETPRYDEFARGRVSTEALLARERSGHALCSWQEIRDMHARRTLDFQSHTLHHHLVAVGPQLIDFFHPRYDRYLFGNITVPVYRVGGQLDFRRAPPCGTPIYRAEPRMAGRPQFFDSERVREECSAHVAGHGGARFFERAAWRRRLAAVFRDAARAGEGEIETAEAQQRAILDDLLQSKRVIEAQLSGARVAHLCYPWYMGSDVAVAQARLAGYQINYWGVVPGRPTTRAGDDLFRVPRLEASYIFRLPGEGRKSVCSLLQSKTRRWADRVSRWLS